MRKKAKVSKPLEELIKCWPWNLAADALGWDPEEADEGLMKKISLLYVPALIGAIGELSDRERGVLRMRYREGMTLEDCGKSCGVTRDRIRQIQERSLRKLRHPRYAKRYILVEPEKAEKLREERDKILLENISLRDRLKGIYMATGVAEYDVDRKIKEDAGIKPKDTELPDIGEMELSVRLYNCLKRSGIDRIDQLRGMTMADLMKVRNLGRKSCIEVIAKAQQWGIEIPAGESNDR